MSNDPVTVTVRIRLKPGTESAFLAELNAIRDLIIREPECLTFEIRQNADDASLVEISEGWASRTHFDTIQVKKAYYPPYFEKVKEMWAEPVLLTHWNDISIHRRDGQ